MMEKSQQPKVVALVRTGPQLSLIPQVQAFHISQSTPITTFVEIPTPNLEVFGAIPLTRTFAGSIVTCLIANFEQSKEDFGY